MAFLFGVTSTAACRCLSMWSKDFRFTLLGNGAFSEEYPVREWITAGRLVMRMERNVEDVDQASDTCTRPARTTCL